VIVSYRKRALRQLDEIYDYLRERNPVAAAAVMARIAASISHVADYPFMGRKTDRNGVHMHAIVDYPYLIFYRINVAKDEVRVISVRHGARRHPGFQEEVGVLAG
jgi:toxin ParE1/3/4